MNINRHVAVLPIRVQPGTRDFTTNLPQWLRRRFASLALLIIPTIGAAQSPSPDAEDWNLHGQTTYVWQTHPEFHAAYTGPNSLTPGKDSSHTLSATLFLGKRLWQDGEFYLNPELLQGRSFTGDLVGLGTSPNGEVTRSAGSVPKLYVPRFFLRQTWNIGGETQAVESGANQLAGSVSANRFVLTLGKFSTLDIFDNNAYAKDPRTQFMNAAHMAYSAFDYASDARGFGWGFAGEWYQDDWALRFGRMTGPKEPNGFFSDYRIFEHYGDQVELEHSHTLGGQPGKVRFLAWRNNAHLSSFQDALNELNANPGADPQTILRLRQNERAKYGLGLNIEQALTENAGVFLRVMGADGRTETHAFTEADSSFATGVSVKGSHWGRAKDTFGLALMRNAISNDRRQYLAAGGISFFIGDGALNYRPEDIVETYYSLAVAKGTWLSAGYQHIQNPAYNADRGPVRISSLRLHAEF